MGSSSSIPDSVSAAAAQRRTTALDAHLSRTRHRENARLTVLLLGGRGTGKTTFLRQLRAMKGRERVEYTPEEAAPFRALVHDEAVGSMKALLLEASAMRVPVTLAADRDAVLAHPRGAPLTAPVAASMQALWRGERALERAWDRRRHLLHDNTAYFVRRAGALAAPGYSATREDVLRCHEPTRAVRDVALHISAVDHRFIEVAPGLGAGTRAPYHRWLDMFGATSSGVLFFVSLADFDVTVADPQGGPAGAAGGLANKLLLALEHWRRIVSTLALADVPLCCLLTKRDVFMDKAKTTPLRHAGGHGTAPRFMDYGDGADAMLALHYVEKLFAAANTAGRPHVHVDSCSLLDLAQKTDTAQQRGASLGVLIEVCLHRVGAHHQRKLDDAERVADV